MVECQKEQFTFDTTSNYTTSLMEGEIIYE